MLAEVFAMYRLHESGDVAYATHQEVAARDAAKTMPFAELHAWTGGEPTRLYQKALAVGQHLVDCCGWEPVTQLAGFFDHQWRPDPTRWLGSLPSDLRDVAACVLGL
jgi:hypothetical protein